MWTNWQLWNGKNLHSTTLSKIKKKYISPGRHLSSQNSLLLCRIPGALCLSCVLTLHPGSLGPLTSLPDVPRSLEFILPLSSKQWSTFLLNILPFSVKHCLWSILRAQALKAAGRWRTPGPVPPTGPTRCRDPGGDSMVCHRKPAQWPTSADLLSKHLLWEPYTVSLRQGWAVQVSMYLLFWGMETDSLKTCT